MYYAKEIIHRVLSSYPIFSLLGVNPGKAVPNPGNIYFQNEGYCTLGDETPKSYGAQAPNSKPASGRSQTGPAAGDTLVANSLSQADVQQGTEAKTGTVTREQEEAGKEMLLNGKMLEKMSCSPSSLEAGALSRDFRTEQAAGGTQVEAEVAEEPKTPDAQTSRETKSQQPDIEKTPSRSGSQREGKSLQEGQTEGGGSPRKTESAPQSPPASRNCADGEGCGVHTDPSHTVRCAGTTTGTPGISDSLPTLKREPASPLPTLQEESKETSEEEDEGEETPKAGSPTCRDPPVCMAVSNVRMPATLLQLLEDSIEC
ncbi:UNVERIFIED_CONTAM: hypothetical protein K2H54_077552 [Gekko kuhli]